MHSTWSHLVALAATSGYSLFAGYGMAFGTRFPPASQEADDLGPCQQAFVGQGPPHFLLLNNIIDLRS